MAPSPSHGHTVPSQRGDLPPPPGQGDSLGLACERTNLNALGLPPRVIATTQNARAVSTRSLYGWKWQVFEGWCDGRGLTSYQCSVPDILCFLQDLMERGRSFSTIKVYLAAFSACHVGFEGSTVRQHPLTRSFMKGARRSLPVIRRSVPGGVPLQDICSAASWASPHTFERYYRLDVTRTSVAHSVLGEKVDIRVQRAAILRSLPARLQEDDSNFLKTWDVEHSDEPDNDVPLGLLSICGILTDATLFCPEKIVVVLEGNS
ncbi:unnamed protein product [Leuciscus chuanchicus]